MESLNIANFAAAFPAMFEAGDHVASEKHHESAQVSTVRRQFEALGRGDMAAFLDGLHPDVELEIAAPRELNWISRARGVDEFRRVVEHNFGGIADQDTQLAGIVAKGDAVVVFGRERGVIGDSRAPYDIHFVYQFTLRDGKLWRVLEIAAAAFAADDAMRMAD